MKFSALAFVLLSITLSNCLTPKTRLGYMTVGGQYGHWNSDRGADNYVTANTFGYHVGMEASLIDMLFLRDHDWRLCIGDIVGASNWINYASYDVKNQNKPDSYYAGFGIIVGVGGTFAISEGLDLGLKYVWDGRGQWWGNATENTSLGAVMPILIVRWGRTYGEVGMGTTDGNGDKWGMTSLGGRFLFSENLGSFLGGRWDRGYQEFSTGRKDITNLLALFYGKSF